MIEKLTEAVMALALFFLLYMGIVGLIIVVFLWMIGSEVYAIIKAGGKNARKRWKTSKTRGGGSERNMAGTESKSKEGIENGNRAAAENRGIERRHIKAYF